ncbi:MAG: hypothetical protein AAB267_04755, partial [Candidatus Desantisbacteria bacterium]
MDLDHLSFKVANAIEKERGEEKPFDMMPVSAGIEGCIFIEAHDIIGNPGFHHSFFYARNWLGANVPVAAICRNPRELSVLQKLLDTGEVWLPKVSPEMFRLLAAGALKDDSRLIIVSSHEDFSNSAIASVSLPDSGRDIEIFKLDSAQAQEGALDWDKVFAFLIAKLNKAMPKRLLPDLQPAQLESVMRALNSPVTSLDRSILYADLKGQSRVVKAYRGAMVKEGWGTSAQTDFRSKIEPELRKPRYQHPCSMLKLSERDSVAANLLSLMEKADISSSLNLKPKEYHELCDIIQLAVSGGISDGDLQRDPGFRKDELLDG